MDKLKNILFEVTYRADKRGKTACQIYGEDDPITIRCLTVANTMHEVITKADLEKQYQKYSDTVSLAKGVSSLTESKVKKLLSKADNETVFVLLSFEYSSIWDWQIGNYKPPEDSVLVIINPNKADKETLELANELISKTGNRIELLEQYSNRSIVIRDRGTLPQGSMILLIK